MMLISRRFSILLLPILCLIAVLSFPSAAKALGPKGDAFVGYSRVDANAFYPNVGGLNGWQAALHLKVRRFVGVEGDVAQYGLGANSTLPRTTTFMAGPKVSVGALGIKIFAHALAGGEHSANSSGTAISGNAFAYALGGGVDARILPFFAWRVGADYINAPSISPSTGNHARFSTGLVFRF